MKTYLMILLATIPFSLFTNAQTKVYVKNDVGIEDFVGQRFIYLIKEEIQKSSSLVNALDEHEASIIVIATGEDYLSLFKGIDKNISSIVSLVYTIKDPANPKLKYFIGNIQMCAIESNVEKYSQAFIIGLSNMVNNFNASLHKQ